MSLGPITLSASSGELVVATIATVGLGGYGMWKLAQRFFRGPKTPDPWDEAVAAEIESDQATPICHRCLTPHDRSTDFCTQCGTSVGQYTNWLPFPYLFSIGHMLRIGTSGEFKRTKLTVFGFLLFSLVEYAVFAPVYWVLLLLKLARLPTSQAPADQPPVSKPG